jgi:nucleotide-binding universal stress UspA family protein
MYRLIVVPLDGSDAAEQALPHASRLARETSAEILLLRAAPFISHPGTSSAARHRADIDAADYLQAQWYRLAQEGLHVRTEVLRSEPVRAISFTARRQGADLIVMSTCSHAAMPYSPLGSVAWGVVQTAMTPVFFVPPSDHPPVPVTGPLRRILVPLDGTPFAEEALTALLRADWSLDSEIVLLRAVASTSHPPSAVLHGVSKPGETPGEQRGIDQERLDAQHYLDWVRRRYLPRRLVATWVLRGSPAQIIIETAMESGAEVIAMVSHCRARSAALSLGSVASYTLQHAPVPVLLLQDTDIYAQLDDAS